MMRIVLLLVFGLLFLGCTKKEVALKNGDFLFLIASDEGLGQAINTVTEGDSVRNYSHQGLLQIEGKDSFVWHSAPGKGVARESIRAFQTDDKGALREMHVYRLPDSMSKHLPIIWKRANVLLGKPYNETYIMEDDGFYCSEFVYALYSTYGIFELKPMTFTDGKTGQVPESWVDHYQKLGIQIPEGKPGCNPNGMAGSPYLTRVR
ncbi:MAG: YiiX/YebB-like N1pC/P60 family cysteine hydrolase [Bacteroidia bacterium]